MKQRKRLCIILMIMLLGLQPIYNMSYLVHADGEKDGTTKEEKDPEYYKYNEYYQYTDDNKVTYVVKHSEIKCGNGTACSAMGKEGHINKIKSMVTNNQIKLGGDVGTGEKWYTTDNSVPTHYRGSAWSKTKDSHNADALTFLKDYRQKKNCGEVQTLSNGSDGTWCKWHFNQLDGITDGCTMYTQVHIMLNSGLVPETSEYYAAPSADFQSTANNQPTGFYNALSLFRVAGVGLKGWGECEAGYNKATGAKWTIEGQNYSLNDTAVNDGSTWKQIYAFKGKALNQMSKSELVQMFQAFWNNDYWVIIGINGAGAHYASGSGYMGNGDYVARHWVMLSGVTDDNFYWLDSAGSQINQTTDKYYGDSEDAVVEHVALLKCDKISLREAAHSGKLAGTGEAGTDTEGQNTLGLTQSEFMGYYDEKDLSAYCELAEVDMSALYLDAAQLDNLSQSEVQSIDSWKGNIGMNDADRGFRGVLRRLVQLFGILLTLWALLLYIAYWVDRLNNFIEIDLVSILTLGKFRISDSEDESTYKMFHNRGKGQRTVNHRNIITISVIALAFGALLMTGTLYKAITKLVIFVIHIFK